MRNPKWTRDELILALDSYFQFKPTKISPRHPEVIRLSALLNSLSIHSENERTADFRNPNGVYMKLCNFLRFDPTYSGRGLKAGGKLEERIWNEFSDKPEKLNETVRRIIDNARKSEESMGTDKRYEDVDHSKWARIVLVELVNHIKHFAGGTKYITYGEIAERVNYPEPHIGSLFGRNIGKTLGVMGHLFDSITVDGEQVPMIQSLLVRSDSKLPSEGIKEFIADYPRLSKDKKKDIINREYKRIFEFGDRWERLLEILDPKVGLDDKRIRKDSLRGRYNPYGSEGSPEHQALRDHISNNPFSIGIEDDIIGITEYPLKSGDSVDVVFETEEYLIGVEVKTTRSGFDDLQRGLFQCIKYSAVLNAEQKLARTNKTVECKLVIEDALPRQLSAIKEELDVEVISGYQVK